MARDTVSMPIIFKACWEVLRDTLTPMRYDTLTEFALQRIGVKKSEINWGKQIADVREKMLLAGQYNSFYIGKPLCLAGLTYWFNARQMSFLKPTDGVRIQGSVAAGIDGAFESVMREPYMLNKQHEDRYEPRRIMRIVKGLILEHHISRYFQEMYPNFYIPPDNDGKFKVPCDHDFKLKIDREIFKIDVASKNRDGTFSTRKTPTDLHILCEYESQFVRMLSVIPKAMYFGDIFTERHGIAPERLLVWLNCYRDNLPYHEIKKAVFWNQ